MRQGSYYDKLYKPFCVIDKYRIQLLFLHIIRHPMTHIYIMRLLKNSTVNSRSVFSTLIRVLYLVVKIFVRFLNFQILNGDQKLNTIQLKIP